MWNRVFFTLGESMAMPIALNIIAHGNCVPGEQEGYYAAAKSEKKDYRKGAVMRVGYERVSTLDQNPELQSDALKAAGCEKIFQDKISGAKADRPGLADALAYLRPGDSLVVWRLDRLGRSLKHLIEIIEGLEGQEAGFISLQEGFDTTTSGGKLIFQIFGALAEFEHNVIRERTNAGLAAARARGRKGGRQEKLTKAQQETMRIMALSRLHTVAEICRVMSITKPTYYRYMKTISE